METPQSSEGWKEQKSCSVRTPPPASLAEIEGSHLLSTYIVPNFCDYHQHMSYVNESHPHLTLPGVIPANG